MYLEIPGPALPASIVAARGGAAAYVSGAGTASAPSADELSHGPPATTVVACLRKVLRDVRLIRSSSVWWRDYANSSLVYVLRQTFPRIHYIGDFAGSEECAPFNSAVRLNSSAAFLLNPSLR